MDQDVSSLLRRTFGEPRPNKRFRFGNRDSSPIRQFARQRFRESVRSMLSGVTVYRPEPASLDDDI